MQNFVAGCKPFTKAENEFGIRRPASFCSTCDSIGKTQTILQKNM